jgi:hypothetical protein
MTAAEQRFVLGVAARPGACFTADQLEQAAWEFARQVIRGGAPPLVGICDTEGARLGTAQIVESYICRNDEP